jgi:putative spermidine/putrescine transport system ATP-binding protein
MSDRIAVFSQGRVQQLADPRTLYERPANLFVASFIGENNRLRGTCIACDGDGATIRLSSGAVIRAAAGAASPGQSCTVSLRPERIAAFSGSIEGQAAAAGNRTAATLAETIYLGDHVRLRMKLADDTDLMATMPVGMAAGLPQPGHAVIAEWSPDFTLVFGS